jgi:hypothetical protein
LNQTQRISDQCFALSLEAQELETLHLELQKMIEATKNVTTREDLEHYGARHNLSDDDVLAALHLHGRYRLWVTANSTVIVRNSRFDLFIVIGFVFVLCFLISIAV